MSISSDFLLVYMVS